MPDFPMFPAFFVQQPDSRLERDTVPVAIASDDWQKIVAASQPRSLPHETILEIRRENTVRSLTSFAATASHSESDFRDVYRQTLAANFGNEPLADNERTRILQSLDEALSGKEQALRDEARTKHASYSKSVWSSLGIFSAAQLPWVSHMISHMAIVEERVPQYARIHDTPGMPQFFCSLAAVTSFFTALRVFTARRALREAAELTAKAEGVQRVRGFIGSMPENPEAQPVASAFAPGTADLPV